MWALAVAFKLVNLPELSDDHALWYNRALNFLYWLKAGKIKESQHQLKDQAVKCLKMSLKINPAFAAASDMLEKIQKSR